MKSMAKINLLILLITLHQISYCSEDDNSRSNSPIEDMFSDVLSQPAESPAEQITLPFSLTHPDIITKSTSEEYVANNKTQTTPKTIKEKIEKLIQYHCMDQDTDLTLTGDIDGKHYEFSIFNNQIREDSQKLFDLSGRILNTRLTPEATQEFMEELTALKSNRCKPSRRISYNSNNDTTKILGNTKIPKQNSSYFTTTNCLIASLTVAITASYLILKDKK